MKTVLYSHDLSINPRQLFVLKENTNKTLDIGIPGKPATTEGDVVTKAVPELVIVGSCPVSDVPKVGHCVYQEEGAEIVTSDSKVKVSKKK
jgi:hypothetical protein